MSENADPELPAPVDPLTFVVCDRLYEIVHPSLLPVLSAVAVVPASDMGKDKLNAIITTMGVGRAVDMPYREARKCLRQLEQMGLLRNMSDGFSWRLNRLNGYEFRGQHFIKVKP